MSGHSHWSSIKYQKGAADAKRGKIFSKLARQISVAAKEKGGDIETNPSLRMIIETSKKFNMPKENVERAIKKGTGEIEGAKYEEIMYEAYGPNNVAIIIEGITDNRNRTLGEIKQILSQYNGKLADAGSVKWMFERKGVISVQIENNSKYTENKDELELKAIDSGAEDVKWQGNILDIYTKQDNLEKVKKNLEEQGIKIESASLDWLAKEEIKLDEKNQESIEKLFEALDENDATQEIFSNIKIIS